MEGTELNKTIWRGGRKTGMILLLSFLLFSQKKKTKKKKKTSLACLRSSFVPVNDSKSFSGNEGRNFKLWIMKTAGVRGLQRNFELDNIKRAFFFHSSRFLPFSHYFYFYFLLARRETEVHVKVA